jgi:lambda family phage portal protein
VTALPAVQSPSGLLDPSGRIISRGEVAGARMKAMLNQPSPVPFAYDAQAWHSQDMGDWVPFTQGPDAEIDAERNLMVARARDLVRNDGWANGSIARILDAAVGADFHMRSAPAWRVLQRECPAMDASWAAEFSVAADAEWRLWADDPNRYCDAARGMTVTQMLRLALRHKLIDGDALALALWQPDHVGAGAARYATSILVLDPDRLTNPYEEMDSDYRRGGIDIDPVGAPLGYWIRRAEPNDWFNATKSMEWDRFPRETEWGRPVVVHDFDRERAGQHRGVGILTSVLGRFKMLNKFDQVSLQAAVLRTLVGFFVKSPYDQEMVQGAIDVDVRGGGGMEQLGAYQELREGFSKANPPMLMGGVRIPKLFSGESIETVSAGAHATEFVAFEKAFLASIAAATGESEAEVSKDYSRMNYSSARAASLSAWKTLLRRRHDFTIGFAAPLYCAWLEEACDRGRLPLPAGAPDFTEWRGAYGRCRGIGPGRGWVDPLKERQGEVLGLDAGFGTLDETVAEIAGADWRERLEQRAVEVEYMKKLGLPMPDWAGGEPAFKTTRPQ